MSLPRVSLLVVVGLLLAVGLVMLFSATAVTAEHSARYDDGYYFLKRQMLWMALSLGAFFTMSCVPTALLMKWRGPMFAATLVLLALVLVPGVGVDKKGAYRWFVVAGWSFQPSEMAKLTLVLFLAGYASDAKRLAGFARGLLPGLAAVAATCALVVVEPDMGTAGLLGFVGVAVLFIGGARVAHLAPAAAGTAAVAFTFAILRMSHFRGRIQAWLEPESHKAGYQLTQSLIALGSGGWTGEGLGRGVQKLYFLPEVHSDFIFAVIGEELGWLGTMGVLALFAALAAVGWRIARQASTRFGSLAAFGLTSCVLLQAAINVAVVTGAMPTKGMPLPFLSFGGSSLFFTLAGMGILSRIARESELSASRAGTETRETGRAVPCETAPEAEWAGSSAPSAALRP